jgi:hypothetical protein
MTIIGILMRIFGKIGFLKIDETIGFPFESAKNPSEKIVKK